LFESDYKNQVKNRVFINTVNSIIINRKFKSNEVLSNPGIDSSKKSLCKGKT